MLFQHTWNCMVLVMLRLRTLWFESWSPHGVYDNWITIQCSGMKVFPMRGVDIISNVHINIVLTDLAIKTGIFPQSLKCARVVISNLTRKHLWPCTWWSIHLFKASMSSSICISTLRLWSWYAPLSTEMKSHLKIFDFLFPIWLCYNLIQMNQLLNQTKSGG